MRDDDDEVRPMGQLFHSGIQPNPERADYALPRGESALEGERAEFESCNEGLNRRRLLAIGAAGGLIAGLASLTTWMFFSEEPAEAPRRKDPATPAEFKQRKDNKRNLKFLKAARDLARGDLEDLIKSYGLYVWVVEQHGGNERLLWDGIEKLGEFALLDHQRKGAEIAHRLNFAFRFNSPPLRLRRLAIELEEFEREWELRQK